MSIKEDVLDRVDLQALAESYGAKFTASGSSRCPIHQGDNPTAFHLYGEGGKVQRWHCFTNCPQDKNDGNAIDLMMAIEGLEFREALEKLARSVGIDPARPDVLPVITPRPAVRTSARPDRVELRQTNDPHPLWIQRAGALVDYAEKQLWGADGRRVVDWLIHERGLSESTIRAARLGLNPSDAWDDPRRWGDERESKIYCSLGVVIPHFADGLLRFVNVRRPLPGDGLSRAMGKTVRMRAGEKPEKYQGPRGGRRGLYGMDEMQRRPVALLTEGEFDCLLARQVTNDIADVVTIGGARMRLDVRGAAALLSASVIVTLYDEDSTGDKGRDYLRGLSGKIRTVRVPDHDLTDYWRHGGPLGAWLSDVVYRQMEPLLAGLDDEAQPDLFMEWLEIYNRALAASTAQVGEEAGLLSQLPRRAIFSGDGRVVLA